MKLLVTGGAGFIGSAVIRHIIAHTGDSVVNVDKLTYAGNLDNLPFLGLLSFRPRKFMTLLAKNSVKGPNV